MKARSFFSIIIALLVVMPGLYAQTPYLQGVRVENPQASGHNGKVTVSMDIVVDGIDVKSNDMIILTPTLKSNQDFTTAELPPVVIAGNKRSKILKRAQKFHNPTGVDAEPHTILKRNNNAVQQVAYTAGLPQAAWMKDATLSLDEKVVGCADCNKEKDLTLTVVPRILPGDYVPVYHLTYIMPEAEVKTRSDRHTATFNYVVDRYELLRNYKGNAAKFAEVDKIIGDLQHNSDLKITEFHIAGYASPEASAPHNRMLAKNRAESFANYLISKFGVSRSQFTVESFGEDWDGLRKAVAASSLADRQAVLNIIDKVGNPDERDAELMKLSGGATYRTLLSDYYPPLRRTEYAIAYNVRPFNVDEAREIIKTNPRLLSLNEMYMVAKSYPVGSKEFKGVFDVAARLYPDSETAIVNSASADIEGGNADAALDRMGKISGSSKAWNNIGVGYARKGDFARAKEYLNKAASAGDADAGYNLKELEKVMNQ